VIFDCARCKLAIVGEDERDEGPRQVLNLGHTVAHAIETVTDYRRYRHGEAVGLGLLAALELSGADDLRVQVRELLEAHGLPTRAEGLDPACGDRGDRAGQEARGREGAVRARRRSRAVRHGAEVTREQLEAAVMELCR